jgi:predicted metal-dependent HD superfamily phosphohydrolase
MNKIGKIKKLFENVVKIVNQIGFKITEEEILRRYSEPHRYWHTSNHLYDLLIGIKELLDDKKIDEREYGILVTTAVFHDIVYDPKRGDNEEKSVDYMMNLIDMNGASWRKEEDVKKIISLVLNTKTHDSKDGLTKKFNHLDTKILDSSFIEMLDWENKIYKEYKWAGWKQYKKNRIIFLMKSIKDHPHNVINIKNLIDFIEKKEPKTGIIYYEIDKLPLTVDFLSMITNIGKIFDNVTIMIVFDDLNYDKKKIKQYTSYVIQDEMVVIKNTGVVDFIKHKPNSTLIKEMKLIQNYDKEIDKHLIEKYPNFQVMYV